MKGIAQFRILLGLAVAMLLGAGCATPDVNPPHARPNTGYVDFRTDPAADLCWEIARFEGGAFNRVFSELKPPQGGLLRLAFAPGSHRFRISCLNRVTSGPTEVVVEVQDGRITPVRLTLKESGTAFVETREVNNAAVSRHGRHSVVGSHESVRYELSAAAEAPVAYQPKEQMLTGP